MDEGIDEHGRVVGPGRTAPTLLRSAWGGALVAARGVSLVLWPISMAWLAIGLIPTWFAFGAGYGFNVHNLAMAPLGLYAMLLLWGMIFGAMIGAAARLARRGGAGSIWDRPIHLVPRRFRRRRDDVGRLPTGYVAPIPWARPRRSWAWWSGLAALAVSAAALGAGLVAGPTVRGRLDRAIAEAERLDPRWRLDEILADRIPTELPEETSSSVVAEIFGRLPDRWLSDAPLPNGSIRPDPSPLRQATDRLLIMKGPEQIDPADLALVARALDEHRELVDRALALADLGEGYHELVPTPNPYDIKLPETQNSRSVARLLALEAMVDASEGRGDEAIDDARAILGVGRSIGDEPFVISGLVRAAFDDIASRAVRRALESSRPSTESLGRIQADLLAERDLPLLLRGMRGERAMIDEVIRRIGAAEMPFGALSGDRFGPGDPVAPIGSWAKMGFDHQRALALGWGNRMVDLARRPPPERMALARGLMADVDAEKDRPFAAFTSTLPLLLFPAGEAFVHAEMRREAILGAMVVLIAADRHRQAHGDWPGSAEAVDPAILPRPPVDPITGKPFVIERSGGRLLVHSVGFNGVDEHGAFDDKKWPSGGADDFGWSVPEVPPGASPAASDRAGQPTGSRPRESALAREDAG